VVTEDRIRESGGREPHDRRSGVLGGRRVSFSHQLLFLQVALLGSWREGRG